MNEDNQKSYIKLLLNLRNVIDSRIDNEITEGVFRGRPSFEDLVNGIEYQLELFKDYNENINKQFSAEKSIKDTFRNNNKGEK